MIRTTTRRLMFLVAITGGFLGWVVHAQRVLRAEPDFGGAFLVMEVIAMAIPLSIAAAIRYVVNIARRDQAYAAQLRFKVVPDIFHRPSVDRDSSS